MSDRLFLRLKEKYIHFFNLYGTFWHFQTSIV